MSPSSLSKATPGGAVRGGAACIESYFPGAAAFSARSTVLRGSVETG